VGKDGPPISRKRLAYPTARTPEKRMTRSEYFTKRAAARRAADETVAEEIEDCRRFRAMNRLNILDVAIPTSDRIWLAELLESFPSRGSLVLTRIERQTADRLRKEFRL
jgi:hypothetical protein